MADHRIQLDELQTMNLSRTQSPIAFTAANAKFLSKFPTGPDELWSVDIKASRHGVQCDFFESVLLVESTSTVHIFGIEFEDGYPRGLNPTLATRQQAFIQFLRNEHANDDEVRSWMRKIFIGNEYSSECKATASYLAVRAIKLKIGVGYRKECGGYELVAVESDSWVDATGWSFDGLGMDSKAK